MKERGRDKPRFWLMGSTLLTALFAGVILIQFLLPESSVSSSGPPPDRPFLVDADEHGALVMLPGQILKGVARSGAPAWEDKEMGARQRITCTQQCPDAVSSGDFGDAAGPPIWRFASHRLVDAARSSGVVILAADARDRYLAVQLVESEAVLISSMALEGTARWPLPDSQPRLVEGPDGPLSLLFLSLDDGSREARLLHRSPDGQWQPQKHPDPQARNGCVSDEGIVSSLGRTVLVRHHGRPAISLPMADMGACAIGPTGTLLATISDGSAGPQTTFRLLSSNGRMAWKKTVTGLTVPTLDPKSGRVAFVQEGHAQLLDASGAVGQTWPGVVDVRFVEDALVLLTTEGEVHWIP